MPWNGTPTVTSVVMVVTMKHDDHAMMIIFQDPCDAFLDSSVYSGFLEISRFQCSEFSEF